MTEIVSRCNFSPGECIDNRYQVSRTLGEGAFGKVFKVSPVSATSENMALKLLKLWEVPSTIRGELQQRFEMEYETGKIESRYLVQSLGYGMVNGNPYIVMEFCPNGDVSKYIPQSGCTSPTSSLSHIALNVLYGLQALHMCGKVHRDLKPENVLLKDDDWAVLTDFGISGDRNKRMTERNILGKPMQIFGTYAYMPPEQVKRMRGDATVLPTTDIFSFGVMLYQLITGELPFGPLRDQNELVLYQQNASSGNWNRQLMNRSGIDNRWTSIIENCLIPDYKQRIQSVDDIIRMFPEIPSVEPVRNNKGSGSGILLRIMQGEEYGKVYDLSRFLEQYGELMTMGREYDNTLVVQEEQSSYVSRHHCTIEVEGNGRAVYVRDGQWNNYDRCWYPSTNGTYINSSEVPTQGALLLPGDILSIGDTKLRFENY